MLWHAPFWSALCQGMETLLALWKGGAPVECLVAWTAGMLLGNNCFFVPAGIVLMLYLCDRFAAPVGSSCLAEFLMPACTE